MIYALRVRGICTPRRIEILSVSTISEIINPGALNKVPGFYRPKAQLRRDNFSST